MSLRQDLFMREVSRLVVLSPDSQYSPSYIARMASAMELDIFVKQTCYGILIEGKEKDVTHVVSEIKKIDPLKIYSKIRAFPLGDSRRCRAHRGSARPGFYFLEQEIEMLPLITKGLECADEKTDASLLLHKTKLSPDIFQRIVEESE